MRYRFNASRGGHAPGHIRQMFEVLAEGYDWENDEEEHFYHNGKKPSPQWVIGQLWNCTDIMPSELCNELELPPGSKYAQGARLFKERIAETA